MNEFTKDELIKLKNGLEYLPESVNLSSKYLEDCSVILKKLESMIDNYCEHEWHSGGNRPWLHCIKCKSNFNHEPSLY